MVGRKSVIDKKELLNVIKTRKAELFTEEGELYGPSHACWKNIVSHLSFPITPKYAYVAVKQKRFGIFDSLDGDCNAENVADVSNEDESSSVDEEEKPEKSTFSVTIPLEKWNELREDAVLYHSSDRSSLKKTYAVLKSGWTSVVQELIFAETKTPCSIAFKRCKIYPHGHNVYLRIDGRCTACNGSLKGKRHGLQRHDVTFLQKPCKSIRNH